MRFRKTSTALLAAALVALPLAAPHATADDQIEFKQFKLVFDVGELSNTNECIPTMVTARYRDPSGSDTWTRLVRTDNNGCEPNIEHLQKFGDFQNTGSTVTLLGGPGPANHIFWKGLTSLTLNVSTPNTPPGRQKNISITSEAVWGQDLNNNWHELFNQKWQYVFSDGFNDYEMFVEH